MGNENYTEVLTPKKVDFSIHYFAILNLVHMSILPVVIELSFHSPVNNFIREILRADLTTLQYDILCTYSVTKARSFNLYCNGNDVLVSQSVTVGLSLFVCVCVCVHA